MRVLSGDLAPVRRGRRRRRGLPVLVVLALAAAAGGAAWTLLRDDPPAAGRPVAQACPAPVPAPAAAPPARTAPAELPRPSAVRFTLLNGTDRNGLARRTGDALAARRFVVARTGNPPAPLEGPSRVYYGPGALPAAALLVAQVEGAELVPQRRAPQGELELVLGTGFTGLNTPARARAVLAEPLPVPDPAPATLAPATPAPVPAALPPGCS